MHTLKPQQLETKTNSNLNRKDMSDLFNLNSAMQKMKNNLIILLVGVLSKFPQSPVLW